MWREFLKSDYPELLSLLLKYEYAYASFTSRISKNNKFFLKENNRILIKEIKNQICGAVLFTDTGIAIPCFDFNMNLNFKDSNLNELLYHIPYSVMGIDTHLSHFLKESCFNTKMDISYYIFENDLSEFKPFNSDNIKIFRAKLKDAENLFSLQKAYEKEEVLIKNDIFNSQACLMNLKNILKYQIVYYASIDNIPITKCNTNALGINYYQIGGIFTKPEFRNRGLAKTLISKLLSEIKNKRKKACLFVKTENIPAIRLYESLGFIKKCNFRISYL